MKKIFSKTFLIASVTVMLSACSTVWNGPGDNPTVAQQHPIAVDSQVVTLTIDVDSTLNDLSDINKARLRAFAGSYLANGHGPVTVTAPSGTREDRIAQEMAADVRQFLNDTGISYASMTGASYRDGGAGNQRQLVVSYTHYVATPSECGIWNSDFKHRFKNVKHPNFGCADQNNLAAMIADPRDLIVPSDTTSSDAASRVRAIEAFRAGETTVSQRDGDIETSVAN